MGMLTSSLQKESMDKADSYPKHLPTLQSGMLPVTRENVISETGSA
jgi:hypothetical protein